ncbi:MAG: 2-oxoacid:acceptor oxidoreductase family protein [Acidobacteriota bacterium]|nr:MAG: 2-oxoacid:acceptor oxidoreductase family protein [Acidobacteriota bacterium]
MVGTEIVMAGFGGQGVLLAGKILAHAAMNCGMEVSWLPSYGPEMRGGTANVIVCISPKPIGSPLITNPRVLVAMNLPSLDKFARKVKPSGLILINASLIDKNVDRDDCVVLQVKARELAKEAGNNRASNMVKLGAYVGASGIIPAEAVEEQIEQEFGEKKPETIPSNIAAFRAGLAEGKKVTASV